VITEGVSGFIVDSIDAAATAARQAAQLDRRKVRAEFERRFTAERMTSDYLEAYGLLTAREMAETEYETKGPLALARAFGRSAGAHSRAIESPVYSAS
jgi:hypothetical protein